MLRFSSSYAHTQTDQKLRPFHNVSNAHQMLKAVWHRFDDDNESKLNVKIVVTGKDDTKKKKATTTVAARKIGDSSRGNSKIVHFKMYLHRTHKHESDLHFA